MPQGGSCIRHVILSKRVLAFILWLFVVGLLSGAISFCRYSSNYSVLCRLQLVMVHAMHNGSSQLSIQEKKPPDLRLLFLLFCVCMCVCVTRSVRRCVFVCIRSVWSFWFVLWGVSVCLCVRVWLNVWVGARLCVWCLRASAVVCMRGCEYPSVFPFDIVRVY